MPLLTRSHSRCRGLAVVLAACGMLHVAGCTEAPQKPTVRYVNLPNRELPKYLQGTIYQYTDLLGTEPSQVSGYGLVTHLHGTGGSRAPTPVRAFMIKELARHDFGTLGNGLASPEEVLNSKSVAIVRVDGYIPPGARCGSDWSTWFDIRVSALPESEATSLAHGVLYQADLKPGGANPTSPDEIIDVKAQAAGEVFVNPNYVLDSTTDSPAARRSRRTGIILGGGRVLQDQPLTLRLRAPERQMARNVERRIIERFQDVIDDDLRTDAGSDSASSKKVANAEDEAVVNFYVPKLYKDNWEHFAGLVQYLYLNGGDPAFAAHQAQVLADEAVNDPKAPLLEISYCLEGLGKPALFAIDPLMTNPKPDVRFAAARAAAFLQDPAAVNALLAIARTPGDPFRVNAVQVLADLQGTPRIDRLCRSLLDSDEALVRIEAYKALTRHGDSSVFTRWVTSGKRERFALDIVHSDSPPGVWVSRQGTPRVAVFGNDTSLELPVMFSALDGRLTISTDLDGQMVTLFYRGSELPDPVKATCSARLPELIAALAGDGTAGGATTLHLGYADVVAVLQALIDQKKVSGTVASAAGQQRLFASFVLQDTTEIAEPIDSRPLVRSLNGGRANTDRSKPEIAPTGEHPLLRPGVEPAAATDPARSGTGLTPPR